MVDAETMQAHPELQPEAQAEAMPDSMHEEQPYAEAVEAEMPVEEVEE